MGFFLIYALGICSATLWEKKLLLLRRKEYIAHKITELETKTHTS